MDCTTSNSLSSVHVPITEKVSLDVKSSSPLVTRKNSKQHAIIQLQNSVPPSSSKISIDRTIYNVFSVPSDGNCFFPFIELFN